MTEYVIVDDDGQIVESGFESREEAILNANLREQSPVHPGEFQVQEARTNSTENDSDDTSTMSDYSFIGNDDEESENTAEQTTVDDKWNWGLGDHSTMSDDENNYLAESIQGTMDKLDGEIEGDLMDVLEDARNLVNTTNVTRFECPISECGLGHSHSDKKHDIRSSPDSQGIPGFNITAEFAEGMKFCPFCHCGANEAAMLVKFFPYIDVPMFKDQQKFEGALEVEPEVLNEMYRLVHEDDFSVSKAAARVANRRGADESELIPLGIRSDIKAFFNRREQIEQQAQQAPISQETRTAIEEARKNLEEVTSE